MILILITLSIILTFVFLLLAYVDESRFILYIVMSLMFLLFFIFTFVFGFFHGVVDYPKTEGIHQGVITAVDLEGVYFRRYEVYLKSSGYTNQSDETIYKIYDYETELAEELMNAIGKTVKIYYGHDGGYIGWKSCGTYHIKKIEIIEDNKEE